VLVWKVEPVFIISMGLLRVPVSVFFIKFLSQKVWLVCGCVSVNWKTVVFFSNNK